MPELGIPGEDCVAIGLGPGTTYGEAFASLGEPGPLSRVRWDRA